MTPASPIPWFARWRRRLLGIPPAAIDFDRLGFRRGPAAARTELERICAAFVDGYHAGLESPGPEGLEARLESTPPAGRGFSFEGAAMALALLDWFTPWRRDRVHRLLAGAGQAHVYLVHVGVGWAWARLPVRPGRAMTRFDPLLRWLIPDGFGFHDGFFHAGECRNGRAAPGRLTGYARRAYDQGLGRSLWFSLGAEADAIARTIAGFSPARQADLWSGIGLAAVYAGGMAPDVLATLKDSAHTAGAHLAQGAAFAAKARCRSRHVTPAAEAACQVLCGTSLAAAAAVTDAARTGLSPTGEEPAYERWRQAVRASWDPRTGLAQ